MLNMPQTRSTFAICLLSYFACLLTAASVTAADRREISWGEARDVENRPLSAADAKWKVLCFLGAECPLARLYGQRLDRLSEEFLPNGVRLIGVNSNPQDCVDDVKQYIEELRVAFPIIKDDDQSWAREFGATRTPEVIVLDADDQVCYRGRIDDQYEPGITRAEPSKHDLRDALNALVAGGEPAVAQTQAVGCLITIAQRSTELPKNAPLATFTRDVAPILNQHCVECHRPGEIGPFALVDYDEVVGWGEMMLEVIDQGRMPPWHADPRYGKFVGARHMPEEDRDTIAAWLAHGMPEGDSADLPTQTEWAAGWQLPTPPDEELDMRSRPFAVPAEGTVEYQYFVVDPHWEEERWVRAAQVAPGNASVVHHAIVFVREPDGSNSQGIGWLGGYVPGQRTKLLPPGHARRIPAGSKLVFQMHYTPNGREAEDVTKIGIWFADADEIQYEVTTRVALNHDFEIPPRVKEHTVGIRMRNFSRDSRLLSATPHMHLRGKSFRLEANQADSNRRKTLLHVPQYDFNWQHTYHFESPLALKNIADLQMQATFDNSRNNPANPNPNEFVTWGDQTWQEMAVAFFDVAHPRGQPRVYSRQIRQETEEAEAARKSLIAAEVDRFLAAMDRDGDGEVVRDEAPDAFRLFGFRRMDHNNDRRLERSEIEAEADRRL